MTDRGLTATIVVRFPDNAYTNRAMSATAIVLEDIATNRRRGKDGTIWDGAEIRLRSPNFGTNLVMDKGHYVGLNVIRDHKDNLVYLRGLWLDTNETNRRLLIRLANALL